MAELPFSDQLGPDDEIQTLPPHPPQGTGLKRAVVACCGIVLTLGLAALVLFGTRAAHRMGQRASPKPTEAAPRPGNVGDPLRGLQTDYSALLAKPPTPPAPAGAVTSTTPAPALPQTPAATPHKPPSAPKDQGMLVLEGKRVARQQQPQPAIPKYGQETAALGQAEAAQPQAPLSTVERQQAFLDKSKGLRETHVQDRLHEPESPWMLLAGDFIPATLVTGIQSDLPGELVARVSREVRDSVEGKTVLIPQGTHLIGTYNNDVVYGQDRVLVVWHRLRLPNGQTIQLQGMPGIDLSGYAGLRDKVDNHLWPLFRAVLLSSVLSIGSRVPAGTPEPNQYYPNLAQEFAQDFGSAANRAGQKIVQRELTRPPTIAIRPGMAFNVFVLLDLVLQPYTGAVATRRP